MKLSDSKELYELIKRSGIHKDPESLTLHEWQRLSNAPEIHDKLLQLFIEDGRNFYQELEMDSPYVNTHRDISHTPEKLQLHSHSFYELLYCESGNIQYLIADKRYRIHAGDIILVPPGVSHRPLFYEEMTEPYSRIVLWLSVDFFRDATRFYPVGLRTLLKSNSHYLLHTRNTPYESVKTYFERGLFEATEQAPFGETALYSNTTTLLVQLFRAFISSTDNFTAEKKDELDNIISYIETHYADKITLEKTAKAFHISVSTLGKLFYNRLGISFYHFVTQRRLINAKLKIEEGSSMEEAALSCGFCDYSAFYRAFKKEYGISPREYRKLAAPMEFLHS